MDEQASGIVLRVRPFTETSLVVNWLTLEFGRISTVAKGARRPKSPYLGKLDLYYECGFSFQRSRRSELHNLREIVLRETHSELRRDIRNLSAAGYAGTLLETATETETPLPGILGFFSLFLNSLPEATPSPVVVYAFEIKLLAELGHGPNLDHPSLSPMAREFGERCLERDFATLFSINPPSALFREFHSFLFHSLAQAFGRVPPQREKALRALKS